MIICYVNKKKKSYWTNNYRDVETFCKENPYNIVEWAFDEKDDLLNGDIIANGKSILGKASLKNKKER